MKIDWNVTNKNCWFIYKYLEFESLNLEFESLNLEFESLNLEFESLNLEFESLNLIIINFYFYN